jgi:hypothetical protein
MCLTCLQHPANIHTDQGCTCTDSHAHKAPSNHTNHSISNQYLNQSASQAAQQQAQLTGRGHVIHLKRDMMSANSAATMTVPMKPPMKPSQVFLGDSLMSGVRPKKKPAATHVTCQHSKRHKVQQDQSASTTLELSQPR